MKTKDLRILLVEDDINTRHTIQAMLLDMGVVHITEANDGEEALIIIKNRDAGINFVICDWNMPKKSGIELLREVRKTNSFLPFLMVTARNDMTSVLEAADAGVSLYLIKPFTAQELKTKIAALNKST